MENVTETDIIFVVELLNFIFYRKMPPVRDIASSTSISTVFFFQTNQFEYLKKSIFVIVCSPKRYVFPSLCRLVHKIM